MAHRFANTPAWIGTNSFAAIDIDINAVGHALKPFLERGSKLTGVSLDEISRSVKTIPTNPATVTLATLIEEGMPIFDAIIWLTAGRPSTTHPLVADPVKTADNIPNKTFIAKSLFYCYFFLLTQAKYPPHNASAGTIQVPNFLSNVMGMAEPTHVYVKTICSFEPQKFDAKWIRFVAFEGFGQEALSRFGLGVAGYRLFGPFKAYDPRDNIPQNIRNAYDFARSVATAPSSWNVHPITRNPNVLQSRGSLNDNLGNLILECFSDAQITEMVSNKMLYQRPVHKPTSRNYRTWAANDDISPGANIFP